MREMKTPNWKATPLGIAAFLLGFSFIGLFAGMLVHEEGHAVLCILYGLPFSWSLAHVVYERSPNPLINITIGLAGGFAQALSSLILLWFAINLEKNFLHAESVTDKKHLKQGVFFGFELAFLTITFHGIINGIWEGLFYQSYEQLYDNLLVWGAIIILCGSTSYYALYRRPFRFLKKTRVSIWKVVLNLANWGRRYKGDFIAGAIAFLIAFLAGWIIQGLNNIATLFSLFGLIIVLIPLTLARENFFRLLLKRFTMARFQSPVKIGVLNGYLTKSKVGKLPKRPYTEYEPIDWYNSFLSRPTFEIDWIAVSEVSGKYDIIINPFGEMYPEADKPNLLTLRKIVRYVQDGGVFINVAGLAFYYLWDGEKQDLTGPLYETYQIRQIPGLLERKVLLRVSHLLDSWLYKQFGIRTTFFDPALVDVYPIADEYFKDLDRVGIQTKVLEFRSAYRSEKDIATLIPLLKAHYKIQVAPKEEITFECYPIAAVSYYKGYLILNGMKLEKARPQDFEKVVDAIIRIAEKLRLKGRL
jgi:hypothetical protein